MPTIVGLPADKLGDLMRAFRSSERPNHIMHAVSGSLSDDEIGALADYLAARGEEAKAP